MMDSTDNKKNFLALFQAIVKDKWNGHLITSMNLHLTYLLQEKKFLYNDKNLPGLAFFFHLLVT